MRMNVGSKYKIITPDGFEVSMYLTSKEVDSCDICNKGKTNYGTSGKAMVGLYFEDSLDIEKVSENYQVGNSCKCKCKFQEIE